LFKEWLIQLFACFLIVTFSSSFFTGKDFKIRSYYSEEETLRRCTTLSMASYFVNDSYSNNYSNNDNDVIDVIDVTDSREQMVISQDSVGEKYVEFEGKSYRANSLLSNNLNSYSNLGYETDSLNKRQIRLWLVNNQKEKVANLFKEYLEIAKEHNLKSSINANEWLNLVYNYPDFTQYKIIGNQEKSEYYYNENETPKEFDSSNYFLTTIDNTQYVVNKFYVPEMQLNFAYQKIADSYTKPFLDWNSLLIYLYAALGISLSLFAFRVTSGKSWLIALVSFGVFNIIAGIFSGLIGSGIPYLILLIAATIFTFVYLHQIISGRKGKKISGITNALLLSLTPTFLPLLVGLYSSIITSSTNYYTTEINLRAEKYPLITFIQDYSVVLIALNLVFVVLMQLYYSKKLKIWRGIAED
jgi:hypothetical protein